jgi:hypothetical protein
LRKRSRPGRRRGRAALFAAALLVTAFTPVVVTQQPRPAAAANDQNSPLASTPVITYNMDGANSGDSNWVTNVSNLLSQAQIVLLQEAGSAPPGVLLSEQAFQGVPGAGTGRAGLVRHFQWRNGHTFSQIYFVQTDRQRGRYIGGRVNLAIVTRNEADEVTLLPNPSPGGRPLLGVRFGINWYFTYHAHAVGPDLWQDAMGEGEDVLGEAQRFVANRNRGETWFVGGDFNVQPVDGDLGEPPSWQMQMPQVINNGVPGQATMYRSFRPTHQNGRELDFGVGSEHVPDLPVTVDQGRSSDHYPVTIGHPMRAGSEPLELYDNSPRLIENMASGGVLDTNNSNSNTPNVLSSSRRRGDASQLFELLAYGDGKFQIEQSSNGKCVQAPGSGFTVELGGCVGDVDLPPPADQLWELHSHGNEQYDLFSASRSLCLGNGNSENWVDSALTVDQCNGSDGQRWLLTPPAHPDIDPEAGALATEMSYEFLGGALENAQDGLLLEVPAPNAAVHGTQRQSSNASAHNWTFDWVSPTVLRISDPHGDHCVEANNDDGSISFPLCSFHDTQEWHVIPQGENEFRLQTGDSCLGLLNSSGPDVATRLNGCAGDSVNWFFAPADTTVPDPEPEEDSVGSGAPGTPGAPFGQQIAMAAYSNPTGDPAAWDRLIGAASDRASVLVANVLNGPGSELNADWANVIIRAHASGKKVLGYVDTGYLGQADNRLTRLGSGATQDWIAQIDQDIDAWYNLYGTSMDGIFFDDGFNQCGAGNVYPAWYREVNDYAKRHHSGAMTVLNPGTVVPQCYADTADVLLTFEGSYDTYMSNTYDLGWTPASPSKIWHIIYGVPADQIVPVVQLAEARDAGYVEITDDSGANPYDQQPDIAYWNREQSVVSGGIPVAAPVTPFVPDSRPAPAAPSREGLVDTDYSSTYIEWTQVSDATRYLVYLDGRVAAAFPAGVSQVTIGGLTPGNKTYHLYVTAQNSAGRESAPSPTYTVTTLSLPGGSSITNISRVPLSASSTLYRADFLLPASFRRIYLGDFRYNLPADQPCWPINYNDSEYFCALYLMENTTLLSYAGTGTDWSWTSVAWTPFTHTGRYTYSWTLPYLSSTPIAMQAEGYEPLTSVFQPCPTQGGAVSGDGRFCSN